MKRGVHELVSELNIVCSQYLSGLQNSARQFEQSPFLFHSQVFCLSTVSDISIVIIIINSSSSREWS